jgi:hypothetical protein
MTAGRRRARLERENDSLGLASLASTPARGSAPVCAKAGSLAGAAAERLLTRRSSTLPQRDSAAQSHGKR